MFKTIDVNHRGMEMRWKNKLFLSLNIIKGKRLYGSKGILRHYHHCSDPKLGLGIVAIILVPFSYHACTIIYLFFGI